MKRAVIFDFGGVIFKTQDRTPRKKWAEKLGISVVELERIVHNDNLWRLAQFGDMSLDKYWQNVALLLQISPEVAKTELLHDFYSGDRVDTEIISLIRDLHTKGHRVALLSNDVAELLRPRMNRLEISHLFDPLIISSEIGIMKPYDGAYTAVLDTLGMDADQTIFIDDRLENIEAANALSIHGIHYKDGMDLNAALEPLLQA